MVASRTVTPTNSGYGSVGPIVKADLEKLLAGLEVEKLFIWSEAPSRAQADRIVHFIKRVCDRKRSGRNPTHWTGKRSACLT